MKLTSILQHTRELTEQGWLTNFQEGARLLGQTPTCYLYVVNAQSQEMFMGVSTLSEFTSLICEIGKMPSHIQDPYVFSTGVIETYKKLRQSPLSKPLQNELLTFAGCYLTQTKTAHQYFAQAGMTPFSATLVLYPEDKRGKNFLLRPAIEGFNKPKSKGDVLLTVNNIVMSDKVRNPSYTKFL